MDAGEENPPCGSRAPSRRTSLASRLTEFACCRTSRVLHDSVLFFSLSACRASASSAPADRCKADSAAHRGNGESMPDGGLQPGLEGEGKSFVQNLQLARNRVKVAVNFPQAFNW